MIQSLIRQIQSFLPQDAHGGAGLYGYQQDIESSSSEWPNVYNLMIKYTMNVNLHWNSIYFHADNELQTYSLLIDVLT